MLKKLMIWAAVLLIAALMAAPAFAVSADLNVEWGSDAWLANQFGNNGDMTEFCKTISQDPAAKAGWLAQYPNLADFCGS